MPLRFLFGCTLPPLLSGSLFGGAKLSFRLRSPGLGSEPLPLLFSGHRFRGQQRRRRRVGVVAVRRQCGARGFCARAGDELEVRDDRAVICSAGS